MDSIAAHDDSTALTVHSIRTLQPDDMPASLEFSWLAAQATDDEIALIDRNYRYRQVNAAFARRYGRNPASLSGRSIVEFVGPALFRDVIKPRMDRALAGMPQQSQSWQDFAGGAPVYFRARYLPVIRADKAVDQVLVIKRDETASRLVEERILRERMLLEEAMHDRMTLLAATSHEIRTPLTAILGFADMMRTELHGPVPERYRDYLAIIGEAGQHLMNTLNSVLSLARLESGKAELQEDEVDVIDLLSRTGRMMAERAEEAGIALAIEAPPPGLRLRIDATRMQQALLNLMTNALRFTARGGHVRLSGERAADGGLVLAVRDDGAGMTEEWLRRVRDLYVSSEPAQGAWRSQTGTGLGLALTRSIIDLHGGRLEIESRPGVGTQARLILPAARVLAG